MSGATIEAARPGRLKITFEGDSWFLRSALPHAVRDASSRVVAIGHGDSIHDLDPGLYVIDAVNMNGERTSRAVQIAAGETVPVTFGYHFSPSPDLDLPPDPAHKVLTVLAPHTGLPEPAAQETALQALNTLFLYGVELIGTIGCRVVTESRQPDHLTYVFAPIDALEQTPVARFTVGDYRDADVDRDTVEVSLPLHNQPGHAPPDQHGYPLNSASVTVEVTGVGTPRLVARFAPERRVASALDRMLGTGAMLDAADVFGQASELLFYKYSDPPAAALGGLTMHRLGRLRERPRWVENLARSFSWLPDGQILLAALLRDDPEEERRRRGLTLLLQASHQRPMFTDGLSLMVDLLRRWPDEATEAERRERVGALASLSVGADLGATCLTTTVMQDQP